MIRIAQIMIVFRTTCNHCGDQQDHTMSVDGPFFGPVDPDDTTHEHLKSEGWEDGLCPRCVNQKSKEKP